MKRSATKETVVETSARARQLFSRVRVPRVTVMSELAVRAQAVGHKHTFEKMRAIYQRRK